MSSVDKNRDMAVCGDAYNRVTPTDPVSLGTTACLNRDEARAQCARHLISVSGTTQAKDLGIRYNETTGKYTADACGVSGGRRKRRTKKSKKGGKSKKSGGRRRRRTQRRNR